MNEIKKLTFFFLLTFCILHTGKAQEPVDSLDQWYILLKNKNEYVGQVLKQERRKITFLTEDLDTIITKKSRVQYLEPYDQKLVRGKTYWPSYRMNQHNLFTPSGHSGEYYFKNTMVYMNTFNLPFTEKSSLGFGFFPIIVQDDADFYFWISPKFSIPTKKENFKMSVGYYGAITPDTEIDSEIPTGQLIGLVYGIGTATLDRLNVSLGTGYGMGYGAFFKWPFYTMNLNFQYKPRFSLHCEVFGGGNFGSVSTIAIRKHTRKGIVDVGWAFSANQERFNRVLLPYGGPFFSVIFTARRTRRYGIL